MDLFLTNMQLLSSPDINWWTVLRTPVYVSQEGERDKWNQEIMQKHLFR